MMLIFLIIVVVLVMKGLDIDLSWLSELLEQLAGWLA
jgi:hypothetical protein